MRKFLIKTGAFTTIFLFGIFFLLSLLKPEWVEGRKKNYLQNRKDKDYDLLIVGSSRAEHVVNAALFDSTKFDVFNIGKDGHGMPSNYLIMKLLLEKYHIKTKKVLLQVDEGAFNGSVGLVSKFRDDYFASEIKDTEVYEMFEHYRGKSFALTLRSFPFLADLVYSQFEDIPGLYNIALRKAGKKKYQESLNKFAITKGYEPVKKKKLLSTYEKNYILEDEDVYYFEKMISLFKSHNIEVIFYRAPILYCEKYHSAQFDAYISIFSKNNNISFWDLKCAYQNAAFYKDQTHIADVYADSVTYRLIDSLKMK